MGVAGAAASPSADSWLRDSRSWQVLRRGPDQVGPPGTRFLAAGVPQRRQNICEGIMLGWLGSPPRRYRGVLALRRRWWCTLNRHLVRSRSPETVSMPAWWTQMMRLRWKICLPRKAWRWDMYSPGNRAMKTVSFKGISTARSDFYGMQRFLDPERKCPLTYSKRRGNGYPYRQDGEEKGTKRKT